MESYKWKIDKHPNEELGWIIYEWKNARLTAWKSGNFPTKEAAEIRLKLRQETLKGIGQQESKRKRSKREVAELFVNKHFQNGNS
ncbi:MAG: hypothetical protein SOS93_05285 [Mannheimia varigena]|nr:hypothetical protein [Mannheimia varigena]